MAHYISSQRYCYTNYSCDSFKVMIDVIAFVRIGASLVDSMVAELSLLLSGICRLYK